MFAEPDPDIQLATCRSDPAQHNQYDENDQDYPDQPDAAVICEAGILDETAFGAPVVAGAQTAINEGVVQHPFRSFSFVATFVEHW